MESARNAKYARSIVGSTCFTGSSMLGRHCLSTVAALRHKQPHTMRYSGLCEQTEANARPELRLVTPADAGGRPARNPASGIWERPLAAEAEFRGHLTYFGLELSMVSPGYPESAAQLLASDRAAAVLPGGKRPGLHYIGFRTQKPHRRPRNKDSVSQIPKRIPQLRNLG